MSFARKCFDMIDSMFVLAANCRERAQMIFNRVMWYRDNVCVFFKCFDYFKSNIIT